MKWDLVLMSDPAASFGAESTPMNGLTPKVVDFGPWPLQDHGFLAPQPVLLELGRGQVAQRRVDPLPIVHVVQEPTQLAVRIGEVPVLGLNPTLVLRGAK